MTPFFAKSIAVGVFIILFTITYTYKAVIVRFISMRRPSWLPDCEFCFGFWYCLTMWAVCFVLCNFLIKL